MGDRIFFVGGTSGFIPDQMIEDLVLVAAVPNEVIAQLSERLKAEETLTRSRIEEISRELIPHEDGAAAVARAIFNFRVSRLETTFERICEWRRSNDENGEILSDDNIQQLQSLLPILIQEYPALNRLRKTERLAGATGSTVESVQLICDIRPIFDEERRHIEAVTPITTLRISFESQGDDHNVSEFSLSPKALDDLIDKATTAKQKLEVLEGSVSDWLPNGWSITD